MSNSNAVTLNVGGFFLPLLTLLLVAGKLFGNLTWSWWWVLAPTWIPIAIVLTVLGCVALFALFCLIITAVIK